MEAENTSWQEKPKSSYPPPEKKPERRLSLKAAMALATRAPGHETLMPLVRKNDETLRGNNEAKERIEAYLLNLQADIINREELLEQREKRVAAREKDLNKRANILRKAEQEIESKMKEIESMTPPEKEDDDETPADESTKEDDEEAEDDIYTETRGMLHERETYIEECENALVRKLTELTEREALIEQREEQLEYKIKKMKS